MGLSCLEQVVFIFVIIITLIFLLILFCLDVEKETLDLTISETYRDEFHLWAVSDGFDLVVEEIFKKLLHFLYLINIMMRIFICKRMMVH
jgi:hypothetical protein